MELRNVAHNLKGLTGFLGASGIQNLATELDAAIRAGRDAAAIESLVAALVGAQTDLGADVLSLPDPRDDAPPPPDWAAARQALAQLEALLAADDARAGQALREAASVLFAAIGEPLRELEAQVARFDYGLALATLRALRGGRTELAE